MKRAPFGRRFLGARICTAVLGLLIALTLPRALALEDENSKIGFSSNHAFQSVLEGENIDLLTGNVNLRIPIGPRYQVNDWFSYQIELYYNSKLWTNPCDPDGCPGQLSGSDHYGQGFNLHFGRIYHHPDDAPHIYRFQTKDGAEHMFCFDPASDHAVCKSGLGLFGASHKPTVVDGYSATFGAEKYHITGAPGAWIVHVGDNTIIEINHNAGAYAPGKFEANDDDWVSGNPDGGWYTRKVWRADTYPANPPGSVEPLLDVTYLAGSALIDTVEDATGRMIDFLYEYQYATDLLTGIELPAFDGTATYGFEFDSTFRLQDPEIARQGFFVDHPFEEEEALPPTPENQGTSYVKKFVARRMLQRIIPPALDPETEYHKFTYGAELYTLQDEPFGMMTSWRMPTGAEARYYFAHYQSMPWRPVHSELRYKSIVVDPLADPPTEYRWTYNRFGSWVTSTIQEALGVQEPMARSNATKVEVLDPFDNVTVYRFRSQMYELPQSQSWGDCNSCGCKNDWDNGLLYAVYTYAGPEQDEARLVRYEVIEHAYDGDWIRNYNSAVCGDPLGYINFIPINVRSVGRTVYTYAGDTVPTSVRRVAYDDWTHRGVSGAFDPFVVPLARETREYDGAALYRRTFSDYAPEVDFDAKHDYTLTFDGMNQLIARSDVAFGSNQRPECKVHRKTLTLPYDLDTPPYSLYCPEPALAPGDVMTSYAYDPTTDSLTEKIVEGGDGEASFTTAYEYVSGVLSRRKQDAFSWSEVDRDVHGVSGLVQKSRDPMGFETTYGWDSLGRLTDIDPPGVEPPVNVIYVDLKATRVKQSLSPDNYTESIYRYDNLGRLVREERRNWKGEVDYRVFAHDGAGRVLCESIWAPWVENSPVCDELVSTRYEYQLSFGSGEEAVTVPDPLGRVSKVTQPNDPEHPAYPTDSVTRTLYEGLTTRVTVEDVAILSGPADVETVYVNDVFGRLIAVDSPGGGADAIYEYDELDNLVHVTLEDASNVQERFFEYDPLGRLRVAVNPESGLTDYVAYDARGNLLSYRDANGRVFNLSYDAAGRLLNKAVLVEDSPIVLQSNAYDPDNGRLVSETSYRIEQGTTVEVAEHEYEYGTGSLCAWSPLSGLPHYTGQQAYLGLNGRLAKQRTTIQPWNKTLETTYCYNRLGVPNVIAYPEDPADPTHSPRGIVGSTLWNGHLIEMHDIGRSDAQGVIQYVRDVTYRPDGTFDGFWRTNGLYNGIERDALGRPYEFGLRNPNGIGAAANAPLSVSEAYPCGSIPCDPIHELTPPPTSKTLWREGPYQYDGAGNVVEIGEDAYYYDELSRLTWATIGETYAREFGYDGFGNMTHQTRWTLAASQVQEYMVDPSTNRLLVSLDRNYSFDANGNMTGAVDASAAGDGYLWDVENRLIEVWQSDDGDTTFVGRYDYDSRGYRVRKVTDEAETYYFRDQGGQILSEFSRPFTDAAGLETVWNRDYVYALGQAVSLVKNDDPEPLPKPWVQALTASQLTLAWEEIEFPDFLRYHVRRWNCVTEGSVRHYYTTQLYAVDPFEFGLSQPSVELCYTVKAEDRAANGATTQTLKTRPFDPAGPPAPSVLATELDQAVRLEWDVDTTTGDFWGYWVERKVGAGAWERLTPGALIGGSFYDFGLTNGVTYTYRVIAIDTTLHQGVSASVAATPHDTTPPPRPFGVVAHADLEPGEIRVRWQAVNAEDLEQYVVTRVAPGGGTTDFQVGAGTTTYLDTNLSDGGIYSYTVAAADDSGNVSQPSDLVSARTRMSTLSPPTSPKAKKEVFDPDWKPNSVSSSCNWAVETDGQIDNPCDWFCANNDVPGVMVWWTAASSVDGYRIYRAPAGTSDVVLVTTTGMQNLVPQRHCWTHEYTGGTNQVVSSCRQYHDAGVPLGTHDYYVASITADSATGIPYESALVFATPMLTHTVEAEELVYDYDIDVTAGPVKVTDGREDFTTVNAASRRVELRWPRVTEPGLEGYHVYRQCVWDECDYPSDSPGLNYPNVNLRTLNCVNSWVRLTSSPISSNFFADETAGGLGGCFSYMVRPIGPNGSEGRAGEATQANLFWADGDTDDADTFCQTLEFRDVDTKEWWFGDAYQFWVPSPSTRECHASDDYHEEMTRDEIEYCRINAREKGPLSSDGPPGPPIITDLNEASCRTTSNPSVGLCAGYHTDTCQNDFNPPPPGYQGCPGQPVDEYNARYIGEPYDVLYPFVTWERNLESDLAGYYVEMAYSEAGPWKRINQDPIAWWETRLDVLGLWLDDPSATESIAWLGPDCVVFRVIAVDENGEESEPSDYFRVRPYAEDASELHEELSEFLCASEPSPPTPHNLTASSEDDDVPNDGFPCVTKLTWDAVPGHCAGSGTECFASSDCGGSSCIQTHEYRIYRFEMPINNDTNFEYRFYLSGTHSEDCPLDPVSGTHLCTYIEYAGPAWVGQVAGCPWHNIGFPPHSYCFKTAFAGFYVTTVDTLTQSESLPSETIFWQCTETPGYVRMHPTAEVEDILVAKTGEQEEAFDGCALEPGLPGSGVAASAANGAVAAAQPVPQGERVAASATRQPLHGESLAIAPMLTLGQVQGTPTYSIYDLHVDHLGSTRVMTDFDGYVVSTHKYFPFGEEVPPIYLDPTTKRYTGHERDEETGLDYMMARYYHFALARFASVDPAAESVNIIEPTTWNRYAYVINNPLKYSDPNGQEPISVATATLIYLGSTAAAATVWLGSANPSNPSQTNAEVMAQSLVDKWEGFTESFSQVTKQAKKHIKGAIDVIQDHLTRLESGQFRDPNEPNDLEKHIQKHLNNIREWVKKLKGKAREQGEELIKETEQKVKDAKDGSSGGSGGATPAQKGLDPDGPLGPKEDPCKSRGPVCR